MNADYVVPVSISGPIIGTNRNRTIFFDGLRGGLSLWVFIGHAAVTAGLNTGFIPPAAIAVDIFMLISGFLMVYTLSFGRNRDRYSSDDLISYYLRRLARIAPVYYLMLMVAVLFYANFAEYSREATAAFPPLWAADLPNDPSIRAITPLNIILHLTFLFGLNPHYASNMPIPDWSLSLEMQFYAVVPFLLMALRKYGLLWPIAGLAFLNFLALRYIGLYLSPKAGGLWLQPSALFFRIDCFLAGMLLALYFFDEHFNKVEIVCLLLVLVCLEYYFIFAVAVAVCFALLANAQRHSGPFARLSALARTVLQSRIMRFFGDISYDLYLLHPLILLAVVHILLNHGWFVGSPAVVRFGVLSAISAMFVVPLSWIIHVTVERPCQKAARPVSAWILARKRSPSSQI